MSELFMTIGEDLPVLVDYDYQPEESGDLETPVVAESVTINAVCVGDIDIMDLLRDSVINDISDQVLEGFDKEEQEPEPERIDDDEYMH